MNERVGLYLRLSCEDDEREQESQSITNQRDFLIDYIQKRGWQIVDTYIDDGFTGTNFNRPSFQRMVRDIEQDRINTVITKDFSRLGRDYITTGFYLERYFPEHRVRYIAVNDGIDTMEANSQGNAMSPFVSVMNDFYARDISKKVRSALIAKKKRGKFVGTYAPFGYRKDPADKGHLLIDDETAPIVQNIFHWYLSGMGLCKIADQLTKADVPTPSQSKNATFTQMRFPGMWNDVIIRRILTNPTYAGDLTQNRSSSISYKVSKRTIIQPENWIVVQGTHEALITRECFKDVQRLIQVRGYAYQNNGKTTSSHLLTGIAFCADCSAPMTFSRNDTRVYMRCATSKKHGKLRLCTTHSIREDKVEKEVCNSLRQIAEQVEESEIQRWAQEKEVDSTFLRQKKQLEQKLEKSSAVLLSLYKDKVDGLIDEQMFTIMQEKTKAEHQKIHEMLEELEERLQNRTTLQNKVELMKQVLQFDEIDRNTLALLVDRVLIHEDKKIDIVFSFENPF